MNGPPCEKSHETCKHENLKRCIEVHKIEDLGQGYNLADIKCDSHKAMPTTLLKPLDTLN